MVFKDLRAFIKALEEQGELQRINQEVHWNLEAGAILRRVYEKGLAAPFFQKIKDYPEEYKIFGGPLGSFKRTAIALGLKPDTHLRDMMEEYLKRKSNRIKPIIVKDGPCKENILTGDKINLFQFPAPMLHEGDGGRYLCTWHFYVQKDLDSEWVNWGMYRAMIQTKNILGTLIEPNQHCGYLYFSVYEARNQPMPMAIVIGPDPISGMVACTKVPFRVSEVEIVGALQNKPMELVKCETIDLYVPSTAEIVIEGEVMPRERMWEGPFGEFTGYRASPRDKRPIMRVKAITHRNNPILTASCMGVPIDDCHAPMSVTVGAECLAALRREGIPVVDLCLYPETAHFICGVSVKVPYANIASRVANCLWGVEAGIHTSYVIVLEDDVDPHDRAQVLHAIGTKCHPYRGITRLEHAQGFTLQPFLSRQERLYRLGAKAFFDCTWPVDWDPSIAVPPRASFDKIYSREIQEHVLKNWKNYGYKD